MGSGREGSGEMIKVSLESKVGISENKNYSLGALPRVTPMRWMLGLPVTSPQKA